MALVVAENLVKSFGVVTAVNGLNLTLNEGSITGLIGPNGAGKTTTIKMILGLLKPDSGKVEVFGQNPWDNPDIRPLIGVVHEKAFFPAHHKVLDYLERTCRIYGVPQSRAMDLLKLVELEDASDRAIKALSAGMLQKFSIAHALVHSPRLVIADEMTANLDPQARSSLFDAILRLHKEENVTFLMSSHILPELSIVCDSVAIVSRGKILASGKLSELYAKYAAGMVRISTDAPEKLVAELKKLSYVKNVETDIRGISVQVQADTEESLYGDTAKIAKKAKAKIYGIETGSASIDELYRRVVGTTKEKVS